MFAGQARKEITLNMDTSSLMDNVRRAVTFDASFYRQAANDERQGQQALQVVLLVAGLSAIGSFLANILGGNFFGAFGALILSLAAVVVGYYIWAYAVQWVGARFFQGQGTAPQFLRTLGYAYAPMALGLLSFIPCFGGLVSFAGWIWSIACGFFAVREVHQIDDGKTLITVIIAWIGVALVIGIVSLIFSALFGISAFGMNALFGR